MAVAENMALARRIERLERQSGAVEPVRVRTRFAVYRRGREPVHRSVADVYAGLDLDPLVELVDEAPDLDILIDAQTGVHLPFYDGEDPDFGTFEELAEGCRVIDVTISCYLEQVEQIISSAAVTATSGGAQAGKTRIVAWWLFRQWMIRGHGVDQSHDREAVFWWIREDTEKLYSHGVRVLLALWPSEVFVGSVPGEKTKNPVLTMCDGSRLAFRHAHHSGKRAGTNLRSEPVEAVVVDELTAILDVENYHEITNRVGKTGGPIAVAYTPTSGHWVDEQIEKPAPSSGGAIKLKRVNMFSNPWWKFATIWYQFLRKGAVTAKALEEEILAKPDQIAASFAAIHDPSHRRMFFGLSAPVGLVLWREWNAERHTVTDHETDASSFMGLSNCTGQTLGARFGQFDIVEAGGKDFNVNPNITVVFRLFGDSARPVCLVLEEIVDIGPTIKNAKHVARLHPGLCMHCDPTGAMSWRPDAHGPKGRTNAEEMRLAGLVCKPAAGSHGLVVNQLDQLDSINPMHRAMHMGLLYVHARCTGVLKALTDMRAKPDGRILKTSGVRSESDQISGYGDALRYGMYPAWRNLIITGGATH